MTAGNLEINFGLSGQGSLRGSGRDKWEPTMEGLDRKTMIPRMIQKSPMKCISHWF
jgi:hypothetical protein